MEEDDVLEEEEMEHFLAELEGRDVGVVDGSGDQVLHEKHYHREHLEEAEAEPVPVETHDFEEYVKYLTIFKSSI